MKATQMGLLSLMLCVATLLGASASGSRHLLAPASDCVTRLTNLAADCSAQIAAITSLGAAIPVSATDAQIQAALANQPKPDAKCCTTSNNFISGGCRCDPSVITIVQGQNINTDSLKTLVRATELTCNFPATIDTCP